MDHSLKVLLVAADVNTIGGIQQYNRNVKDGIHESGAEVRLIELKGPSYERALRGADLLTPIARHTAANLFAAGIAVARDQP